jgi:hypothetical protein
MRVRDDTASDWLVWARNFGEVVAWRIGRGGPRRVRVRVPPGITRDGMPFRPKRAILDFMGHGPDDVVPAEMMLTVREAIVFGMGCAVGRTAALMEPADDWQRDRAEQWTAELRAQFVQRREDAREADRLDGERERAEREAERLRRAAEYRRRKAGTRQIEGGS